MADHTHIEWTDATWNPITGCSVISPGCTNCYAMKLAGTRLRDHPSRQGLTRATKAGPVWTGVVRLNEQWLDQPLLWKRSRRIFVGAHTDLFHESVPVAWLDKVFAVMALAPQHTFQVLTKRAARMQDYMARSSGRIADKIMDMRSGELCRRLGLGPNAVGPLPNVVPGAPWWPLPNVWLGVSAEDQTRADERIPLLLDTPATVRWLSAEPLLGPLDLTKPLYTGEGGVTMRGYLRDPDEPDDFHYHARKLDWVVVGGENGDRPMHPDWALEIRDACAVAGVPFVFKQWGTYLEFEAGEPNREVDADSTEAAAILRDVGRYALVHKDGRVWRTPSELPEGEPARLMLRVGKRAAGRLLDGVTHDAYPEVRP